MTTVHLIGSQGFIGRALQDIARDQQLHTWSHRQQDPDHHFDLLNPTTWQALLNHRPSHVIFLSWPGLPNFHELFHITRNLPAAISLLEQLVAVGLEKVVLAGTCSEYGLQNGPLREDYLTNPLHSYAIAKDSLRRVSGTICSQKGVQCCWVRIFYPYGPRQNPSSLLPSLLKAIQSGEPEFNMSSGRQIRDFIPVHVVAQQLLTLALHPSSNGVYNGGTGQPRSVLELAEEAVKANNSSIALNRGVYPDRSDEPLAFWADMQHFNSLSNESSSPV